MRCAQILTIAKARLLDGRTMGRLTSGQMEKAEIAMLLSVGVGLRP